VRALYPSWHRSAALSEVREVSPCWAESPGSGVRYPDMGEDEIRGHTWPIGADESATEQFGPLGPAEGFGQSRTEDLDTAASSGWITTEVAARAVRVSPRTIRRLIDKGKLEAKAEGEGVRRRWLVSVDSLHALRMSQVRGDESPRTVREEDLADNLADVIRDMSARLEDRTAEAVEMRTRFELTERTRSSMEAEAAKLREENERLRSELEAERSKGFWRRLFGG
jgi:excisionase family DNA binding protein